MTLAVPFHMAEKNDLSLVGGKGYNLIRMYNEKLNVPNGFVVTTKAYFDFLNYNKLTGAVQKKLKGLDVEDTERLDMVSSGVRGLLLNAQFPSLLMKEIENYVKKYTARKFAVRSSSTAEDLAKASFAGQQDTYLNVKKKDIAEHVKKCFASLFTSRAIYYREKNRFPHTVGIAVVVQEMVDSDFSGVMFTVDPIHKKFLLIEIASGLGEKIVSGSITPNNYFLERKTFETYEKHEEEEMDEELVRKIADIGIQIENYYGKPQDIEFAVKNGKIFILQARPITTL